jgi:hypothetical protein
MNILSVIRNRARGTIRLSRCYLLLPTISLRLKAPRKKIQLKIEGALSHREGNSPLSLTRCFRGVQEPRMNRVLIRAAPLMMSVTREVSLDIMGPLIMLGLEGVPLQQMILRSEMIIHRYNNTKYISTS